MYDEELVTYTVRRLTLHYCWPRLAMHLTYTARVAAERVYISPLQLHGPAQQAFPLLEHLHIVGLQSHLLQSTHRSQLQVPES